MVFGKEKYSLGPTCSIDTFCKCLNSSFYITRCTYACAGPCEDVSHRFMGRRCAHSLLCAPQTSLPLVLRALLHTDFVLLELLFLFRTGIPWDGMSFMVSRCVLCE